LAGIAATAGAESAYRVAATKRAGTRLPGFWQVSAEKVGQKQC
jgi:hypothetical protein